MDTHPVPASRRRTFLKFAIGAFLLLTILEGTAYVQYGERRSWFGFQRFDFVSLTEFRNGTVIGYVGNRTLIGYNRHGSPENGALVRLDTRKSGQSTTVAGSTIRTTVGRSSSKEPTVADHPTTRRTTVGKSSTVKPTITSRLTTIQLTTQAKTTAQPTTLAKSTAQPTTTTRTTATRTTTTRTTTTRTTTTRTTTTRVPSSTLGRTTIGLTPQAVIGQNDSLPESRDVACKFPILDPFDKSILKYVDSYDPLVCKYTQPYLSHIDKDGFVHLNRTEFDRLNRTGSLQCTMRTVDRAIGSNDNALAYGNPKELTPNSTFDFRTADTAEVKCTLNGNTTYHNLHNHPKKLDHSILPISEEQLSVFMIGLDGVSLSMFRRKLPKTYKYITETMGVRIFNGYTKVGDNSFPNIVPMLTGKRAYDQGPGMPDESPPSPHKQFDSWDLIWKHYSKRGYATAFIEDDPGIGAFHYLVRGFAKKPVDHYLRPYFLARGGVKLKSTKWCFGNVAEASEQLDISMRLLREYKDRRLFQFNFYVAMTHYSCCEIQKVDHVMAQFFSNIHREGLLNRTMMVVFSDHGSRYAAIRATLIGLLEARMPTYGIYFPPWFYAKHPHIDRNLKVNQHRLSSNFDVHQLLLDILHSNFSARQLPHGTRGLSQLYELPADRTCPQAGIPEHFCVCTNPTSAKVSDPAVVKAAGFLIKSINEKLSKFKKLCAKLTLDKTMRAEVSEPNQFVAGGAHSHAEAVKLKKKTKVGPRTDAVRVIRVLVSAKPSNGQFEGQVHLNTVTGGMTIPGEVARVNLYGNQSVCIDDKRLRLYCFCK